MTKKLAVAVIHGMGKQENSPNAGSDELSFSKDLHKQVRRVVGGDDFDQSVEWREIYWADILQTRQSKYFNKIAGMTDFDSLRQFVMFNLSDAASYRKMPRTSSDQTYKKIHGRIDGVIKELSMSVGPDAPLVIIAHSLGGHIMSNYVYDMQKAIKDGRKGATTAMRRMHTVTRLFTFGCNIPVFVFAYPESDVTPIDYPGSGLPSNQRTKPWWVNFYDRDDVLGFPLAQTSPDYKKLKTKNELADIEVNSGSILTAWNPISHNLYWKDEDVYRPIGLKIASLINEN